jgi:hypothetical protein
MTSFRHGLAFALMMMAASIPPMMPIIDDRRGALQDRMEMNSLMGKRNAKRSRKAERARDVTQRWRV